MFIKLMWNDFQIGQAWYIKAILIYVPPYLRDKTKYN